MDEQGYAGPATLAIGADRYEVQVELRGVFQPIDGRFHWYGRIAAHDGLAAALGPARVAGTLATPEGQAACEVSDPDPWRRYRVSGRSTPPFAVATDLPPEEAEQGEDAEARQAGVTDQGHVRVAIIGTGFGGLGAAIALRRSGRRDFVILERAGAVGGTWRDNTYPGCACDVPSHLYSFSFAPNPAWSRSFSPQPEIRRYLEDVTDRYGLRRHIRFGTEVTEARWDSGAARWRLPTSPGRAERRRAGLGGRAAVGAGAARRLGPGHVPRRGLPLGALEPRLRPGRPAGRGGRHRGVGHPDRARDPARGQRADAVPAHPGLDHAAPGPPDQRAGALAVPARPGDPAAGPDGPAREPGGAGRRVHPAAGPDAGRAAGGAGPPGPVGAGPGPAPGADPGLRDGLQADPAVRRLLSRAGPAQRAAGHLRPGQGGGQHADRPGRHRGGGRRADPGHRLPRHRHAAGRPDLRPRTAPPWPGPGARTCRPCAAPAWPGSRTCA